MATVLITGCDSGLGVELARQYAADGHRVIASCLDPSSAKETAGISGNIELVKLDVTDHAAIEALSKRLTGEAVDILLNNAGIARPHPPFGQTDYASWRRILEVNLIGPMKMAESFVEQVARSDQKMQRPKDNGVCFKSHGIDHVEQFRRVIRLSFQQGRP